MKSFSLNYSSLTLFTEFILSVIQFPTDSQEEDTFIFWGKMTIQYGIIWLPSSTIARKSNQSRSPSADERITNCCIYTVEFYSSLSKDESFGKMSRIRKHCTE